MTKEIEREIAAKEIVARYGVQVVQINGKDIKLSHPIYWRENAKMQEALRNWGFENISYRDQ